MKKFIIRLTCFCIITIAVLVAMVGITIFIMQQASFKIDHSKNILVLGASLTEAGIDDTVFKRAINLSQSGTAYMYSYCKLKKILENNPQIDTVLLSFNYSELTENKDIMIQGEEYLVPHVSFLITLLSKDEFMVYKDKIVLLQAILKVPIRNAGSIVRFFKSPTDFSYKDLRIGDFAKLHRHELPQSSKNRQVVDSLTEKESFLQRDYLLKMVDCCKEHHVKLILLCTPIYKSEFYENTAKLLEYHKKYVNEIDFLDYSNFKFPDDSYYAGVIHLNYKGAEFFTNYLQKNLANDLKMKDEKE